MKIEYILKGLDCPGCAAKIEAAVKTLDGVSFVGCNFLNSTLILEAGEPYIKKITAEVIKIVHKYEPDVEVVEKQPSRQMEFTLEGLDCPDCAAKIEAGASSLDGVFSASCSPITSSLILQTANQNAETLTKEIEKIVHRYEPEVKVVLKEKNAPPKPGRETAREARNQIIQLALGAALFLFALVFGYFNKNAPYFVLGLYIASYLILGWKVLFTALRKIFSGSFFDENFLMSVATIGAFAIGEYPEGVAVMLFYLVGEFFQGLAVRKSKKSITDLMDIRPDYANLMQNGQIFRVSPETINIGDAILVKPGEKIPLDGKVAEGESLLDTKALTGESVPRKARAGDDVISGCININGVLTVIVTKTFGESTVSKIIELVENAATKKAPTENFITSFSKYYTPVVVVVALLLAVIPPLAFGELWAEWIRRALVFLVISCPCALVVSIPLGFFGGIGGASRKGVLIKGSNYLEALNRLEIVVFDKTGTLTEGVFEVTAVYIRQPVTREKLLKYAACAEVFSNHPIALSILKEYGGEVDKSRLGGYTEIAGHGISVTANGEKILVGNDKLMRKENIEFSEVTDTGTKVYVAAGGVYAGCILISDKIKPDSRLAVSSLKKLGVKKTVMLTGDDKSIAEAVGEEIGIDEVYAGLLPQQKVEIVEALNGQKRPNGKLAFVGDGINDAPVLARSDVGIAMGGLGSDAAIEAADVVLMTDEPSKLISAVSIARKTKRIVWQNIIFALSVKAVFLILGAWGISGMWEAVFADVGVSLLAILNSLRAMRVK